MFDVFDPFITKNRRGGYSFFSDPLWSSFEAKALPAQTEQTQFSKVKTEIDGQLFSDIRLAAPGLKRDDFSVEVFEESGRNFLTIGYAVEHSRDYVFASRKASKTYRLPKGVTQEQIKARYEDGVLHVLVPETEEKKLSAPEVHKINIE